MVMQGKPCSRGGSTTLCSTWIWKTDFQQGSSRTTWLVRPSFSFFQIIRELNLSNIFTENPYTAAQNFIHREELSQTFLDEIARFIINNTKGATLGMGSGASDPYTGEGRYSGGGSAPNRAPAPIGDPFTGSGAYSTQSSSVQPMDVQFTPPPQSSGYFPKVPVFFLLWSFLFSSFDFFFFFFS